MPSCRVTNNTPQPLNVCLKQVTALHFENGIQSGQTIKLKPGKVWFTLEAKVDDGTKKSRYSVLKSAATIALLSIAVAAGGTAAGAYLAKGMTLTKGALIKNSGTIAKISSVALPKAIEKMSSELGGLSALQREVMSIVASPTLSSDVRHKATGLLRQLYDAYTSDKDKTADAKAGAAAGAAGIATASAGAAIVDGPPTTTATTNTAAGAHTNEVPAFKSPDPRHINPETQAEARALETELDQQHLDDRVEDTPVSTDEILRVHGIYMSTRRHFEIRVDHTGRLVLWDAKEGKVWGT